MCSADIIREINATIFEIEPKTEYSRAQPQQAIKAILQADVMIFPVGEIKLRGLGNTRVSVALVPWKLGWAARTGKGT